MTTADRLVELLDDAQTGASAITRQPDLDEFGVAAAYEVQHAVLDRRLSRGERRTGVKLGFTSKAKQLQMGVDDVIVGQLTDRMRVADGASLDLDGFIHPRVEPEIAFRLGRDVNPDDPAEDVMAAVDAVAPALEVIDSRYEGFSFGLPGVIADNTSAAAYAIGPWVRFGGSGDPDLSNRGVSLTRDDARLAVGSTAAILGHPLRVLPELLAMARRHGFALEAGSTVLAGAATAAQPLSPGVFGCRVAGLGQVCITVAGGHDE